MDNYVVYNGELYHYGVPGMKWGKRKGRSVSNNFDENKDKTKNDLSKKEVFEKRKKIGAKVVSAFLITSGMSAATKLLAKNTKTSKLGKLNIQLLGQSFAVTTGIYAVSNILQEYK